MRGIINSLWILALMIVSCHDAGDFPAGRLQKKFRLDHIERMEVFQKNPSVQFSERSTVAIHDVLAVLKQKGEKVSCEKNGSIWLMEGHVLRLKLDYALGKGCEYLLFNNDGQTIGFRLDSLTSNYLGRIFPKNNTP
jgi:hypothetical protein